MPEMRKRFNVAGLPTVILAKAGGEEIDRTLGFMPTDEFVSTMGDYHKGIGTLAAMTAEEEKKGDDPEFLYVYGEKLYAHGRFDDADSRFAGVVKNDPENKTGNADDAQLYRAKVYRKLEQWPLAVAFCEALPKLWPSSDLLPDATIYAAYYSDKGGMTNDAISLYEEYLQKWPKGEDAKFAQDEVKRLKAPPSDE